MGTKDTHHSAEQLWIQHRTARYIREESKAGGEEVSLCKSRICRATK